MKKGFFFSLDAFFAIIIFILMLVSVYGYFINTQELRQQYFFSEDLFDIFINTKMEELNFFDDFKIDMQDEEEGYPTHANLLDGRLTIMEQLITLNNNVSAGDPIGNEIAGDLIDTLTLDLFDERYGFNFNVRDWFSAEDEDANAIVSRQRFVSGVKIL